MKIRLESKRACKSLAGSLRLTNPLNADPYLFGRGFRRHSIKLYKILPVRQTALEHKTIYLNMGRGFRKHMLNHWEIFSWSITL